jgi:hypothetical protein
MKKNMGVFDRSIRFVIATLILTLYFTNVITGTFAIVLLIITGLTLLTGIIGICPLYLPFGINTCKSKN